MSKDTKETPAMEYVTIPAKDLFDAAFPDIWHNRTKYEAGKTHLVPVEVAKDLKERLNIFAAQQIRILQPKKDTKAIDAVSLYGQQGAALDRSSS